LLGFLASWPLRASDGEGMLPVKESRSDTMKAWKAGAAVVAVAGLWAGAASAAIPADVQARMREMGRVVAPVDTAKLYRPMFDARLLDGVTVVRDVSFGADPKLALNVYKPAAAGPARPVL